MKIAVFCNNNEASQDCFNRLKELSDFEFCSLSECFDANFILSIGGDGCALACVPYALMANIPIIAVNTGKFGFLCAYNPEQLDVLIDDIINSKVLFTKRNLIECECDGKVFKALNEVVIERDNSLRCETNVFSLYIDGKLTEKLKSDGYIIATPTGSTAYSLSAGGSVLHPTVEAFIATPICGHNGRANSIVYPQVLQTTLTVDCAQTPCLVFCDGNFAIKLQEGRTLIIRKSESYINLAVKSDFLTLYNNKFKG